MKLLYTQKTLDEINTYVDTYLIEELNSKGLSFPAVVFIAHSIIDAVNEAQNKLDKE